MADFSKYAPFSKEFELLQETLPTTPELSVQQLKDVNNKGREEVSLQEMEALADLIETEDHRIPTRCGSVLEARTYRSKNASRAERLPLYIHLHGGGFLFGTLDSENAACARIAIGAPVTVLNVNYRHTPEFTYPTAWHDAEDAFEWGCNNAEHLHTRADCIIVGGTSAGAWLTAALAQTKQHSQTASSNSLVGQILMIPCLVHPDQYNGHIERLRTPEISSYVQNEFAPILPRTRINLFTSLVFAQQMPEFGDRKANPGNADAFAVKGLPPTVFGIGGADPLRDEGLLYEELLRTNETPTKLHVFQGVPHGFRRFGAKLPTASAAWDHCITDGIRWILDGPKASEISNLQVH